MNAAAAAAAYPMVGAYDNMLDSPADAWRELSSSVHIKQEASDTHDDSGISPGHGSSEGPSPDRGGPGAGGYSAEDYYRPEGVGEPAPPPPPTEDASGGPGNGGGGDDHSVSSSQSDYDGGGTGGEDALRRLQVALETSEALRPGGGAGGPTFQCPLCTFRTTERPLFDSHLGTHCEHKCPACEHVAPSNDALRAHMRETHALSPPQDDPAETRVNSQGRVKTFRCKQCGFVAITKLGFWEHSRCHIRAEKLLTCPRCPFVTEYKHHLEYHLRNHTGSKPFRCDKCPYSCVNKSMLNSHLKSHSNVYQYRCADCSYATKYCHSLKLHLRKYAHRPDTVLNPDGSPNPLPIIDVYGTRRGPKQRPRTAPPTPDDVKPFSPPSQFSQSPFTLLARPGGLPFPYNAMPFPPTTTPMAPAFPYSVAPREGSDAVTPFFNNNNNEHLHQEESEGFKDYISRVLTTTQLLIPKVPMPTPPPVAAPASDPLDLSKPEPAEAQGDEDAAAACVANSSTTTTSSPSKSRRKGKAFKLERIAMKLQYQQLNAVTEGDAMDEADEESGDDAPAPAYSCAFCDITFRDVVMYSLHKGYHGHKDPFTCNACGQQTADKLDFFLHIARSPHS